MNEALAAAAAAATAAAAAAVGHLARLPTRRCREGILPALRYSRLSSQIGVD